MKGKRRSHGLGGASPARGSHALVRLTGGEFAAVLRDGNLATVSTAGTVRRLAARPVGAIAATRDGRLLTTTEDPLVPGRLALTVVDRLAPRRASRPRP